MSLTIQTIRIGNRDDDHGALIFAGEFLLAVLSRLSAQHGEDEGHWYLECGFGPASDGEHEFSDFDAAFDWVSRRVAEPGSGF